MVHNGDDSGEECSVDARKLAVAFRGKKTAKAEASPASSTLDRLSDDLVLRILAHLPADSLARCGRACRRLRFLAWEPSLWRDVRITAGRVNADAALAAILAALSAEGSSPVERLTVSGSSAATLTDEGLRAAVSRCPSLQRLELRSCPRLTSSGLGAALSACSHLEVVEATGESFLTHTSL